MADLLTREDFNKVCLDREGHKCINCDATEGLSVHHIMERKLWEDGGYYEENGVAICPECHILAESCFIMPNQLWNLIEYRDVFYPMDFDPAKDFDKWGQEVLFDEEDDVFIVLANQFEDKFCKAVILAGGMTRVVSAEWLDNYIGIDADDEDRIIYAAKLKAFQLQQEDGLY